MSDLVKFGIMGCGTASSYHILGIKKDPNPNIKFVAAYDINERNLNRVSKRNKFTPFTDLDKFLQSDIEAVFLLVPHFLHADLTERIAEAGKHILYEKPRLARLKNTIECLKSQKNLK